MKHGLSHTLALIGLGFTTLAVTPIHAQTTAPGPYYATPSWDQTLPAATRFIVLSNMNSQAVLDRETGLVWERVPSTTEFNWASASSHCLGLNLGGRMGWRLPTLPELMSLVDQSQTNPSLPSGHPFTVRSFVYWSATTDANEPSWARTVIFFAGQLFFGVKANTGFLAWCVRGGQGVDTQ